MWLQVRLYLLVGLLLAIVYGVMVAIASATGGANFIVFAFVAVGFVLLATALYKLVLGSARVPKESMRKAESVKAFFVNDPGRALYEVRELKEIDLDLSGTIDYGELLALRSKSVRIKTADKIVEMMSTHPNMLKRIKHLSTLA